MKAKYRIRFFIDWGGICFWGNNEEARAKYGYAIECKKLPLSDELIDRANQLMRWHDDSLNWDYPPDPGHWRQEECDRFNLQVRQFYDEAKAALGNEYEVIFEQTEINEDPDLDKYLKDPQNFKRKN